MEIGIFNIRKKKRKVYHKNYYSNLYRVYAKIFFLNFQRRKKLAETLTDFIWKRKRKIKCSIIRNWGEWTMNAILTNKKVLSFQTLWLRQKSKILLNKTWKEFVNEEKKAREVQHIIGRNIIKPVFLKWLSLKKLGDKYREIVDKRNLYILHDIWCHWYDLADWFQKKQPRLKIKHRIRVWDTIVKMKHWRKETQVYGERYLLKRYSKKLLQKWNHKTCSILRRHYLVKTYFARRRKFDLHKGLGVLSLFRKRHKKMDAKIRALLQKRGKRHLKTYLLNWKQKLHGWCRTRIKSSIQRGILFYQQKFLKSRYLPLTDQTNSILRLKMDSHQIKPEEDDVGTEPSSAVGSTTTKLDNTYKFPSLLNICQTPLTILRKGIHMKPSENNLTNIDCLDKGGKVVQSLLVWFWTSKYKRRVRLTREVLLQKSQALIMGHFLRQWTNVFLHASQQFQADQIAQHHYVCRCIHNILQKWISRNTTANCLKERCIGGDIFHVKRTTILLFSRWLYRKRQRRRSRFILKTINTIKKRQALVGESTITNSCGIFHIKGGNGDNWLQWKRKHVERRQRSLKANTWAHKHRYTTQIRKAFRNFLMKRKIKKRNKRLRLNIHLSSYSKHFKTWKIEADIRQRIRKFQLNQNRKIFRPIWAEWRFLASQNSPKRIHLGFTIRSIYKQVIFKSWKVVVAKKLLIREKGTYINFLDGLEKQKMYIGKWKELYRMVTMRNLYKRKLYRVAFDAWQFNYFNSIRILWAAAQVDLLVKRNLLHDALEIWLEEIQASNLIRSGDTIYCSRYLDKWKSRHNYILQPLKQYTIAADHFFLNVYGFRLFFRWKERTVQKIKNYLATEYHYLQILKKWRIFVIQRKKKRAWKRKFLRWKKKSHFESDSEDISYDVLDKYNGEILPQNLNSSINDDPSIKKNNSVLSYHNEPSCISTPISSFNAHEEELLQHFYPFKSKQPSNDYKNNSKLHRVSSQYPQKVISKYGNKDIEALKNDNIYHRGEGQQNMMSYYDFRRSAIISQMNSILSSISKTDPIEKNRLTENFSLKVHQDNSMIGNMKLGDGDHSEDLMNVNEKYDMKPFHHHMYTNRSARLINVLGSFTAHGVLKLMIKKWSFYNRLRKFKKAFNQVGISFFSQKYLMIYLHRWCNRIKKEREHYKRYEDSESHASSMFKASKHHSKHSLSQSLAKWKQYPSEQLHQRRLRIQHRPLALGDNPSEIYKKRILLHENREKQMKEQKFRKNMDEFTSSTSCRRENHRLFGDEEHRKRLILQSKNMPSDSNDNRDKINDSHNDEYIRGNLENQSHLFDNMELNSLEVQEQHLVLPTNRFNTRETDNMNIAVDKFYDITNRKKERQSQEDGNEKQFVNQMNHSMMSNSSLRPQSLASFTSSPNKTYNNVNPDNAYIKLSNYGGNNLQGYINQGATCSLTSNINTSNFLQSPSHSIHSNMEKSSISFSSMLSMSRRLNNVNSMYTNENRNTLESLMKRIFIGWWRYTRENIAVRQWIKEKRAGLKPNRFSSKLFQTSSTMMACEETDTHHCKNTPQNNSLDGWNKIASEDKDYNFSINLEHLKILTEKGRENRVNNRTLRRQEIKVIKSASDLETAAFVQKHFGNAFEESN